MRDPLKDKGRLEHMLEMAVLLEKEKYKHSLDIIIVHAQSKCAFSND